MTTSHKQPSAYIRIGVVASIVGVFLLAAGASDDEWEWATLVGPLITLAGGAYLLIGVIALGVTVGLAQHAASSRADEASR